MNLIEAQARYPELYADVLQLARARETTILGLRHGQNMKEVAERHGIIITLYKRYNYNKSQRFCKKIGAILNMPWQSVKSVIQLKQERS